MMKNGQQCTCDENGGCVETCTDTCESLGYECGTHIICGVSVTCPNKCSEEETCNAYGRCVEREPPVEPPSCFPAGTLISMADGSYKPIEDVVVGDLVLSFDFGSGRNVKAEVLGLESPVRNHMCELLFEDNSKLMLTDEHPVYTLEGWKSIVPEHTELEVKLKNATQIAVSKLGTNDFVDSVRFNPGTKEFENYLRRIISISCENKTIQTYNLKSINNTMTFYADNVLVHNKCDPNCDPSINLGCTPC